MPLGLNFAARLTGTYDQARGLQYPLSQVNISLERAFADGAGAGAAQQMYSATRNLTSGQTETLDLNGTTLLDIFGVPMALLGIKGLMIQARDTNTVNITLANAANAVTTLFGATYSLTIQPGEVLSKVTNSAAGYGVTATTADLLSITAGAAACTYDIIVWGRTA